MRWSKLKHITESRFADSVRGRVQIFSTRYSGATQHIGRGWIEVDGQELVDFSSVASIAKFGAYYHESTDTICVKHPAVDDEDRTPGLVAEAGEFSRYDLHEACWALLEMPVSTALQSDNPIILALTALDRRVGKRRLSKLAEQPALHPLVKNLMEFRLAAESKAEPFNE